MPTTLFARGKKKNLFCKKMHFRGWQMAKLSYIYSEGWRRLYASKANSKRADSQEPRDAAKRRRGGDTRLYRLRGVQEPASGSRVQRCRLWAYRLEQWQARSLLPQRQNVCEGSKIIMTMLLYFMLFFTVGQLALAIFVALVATFKNRR